MTKPNAGVVGSGESTLFHVNNREVHCKILKLTLKGAVSGEVFRVFVQTMLES